MTEDMPEDVKAAALKVRQGLCLDCECTYERGCGCLSAISTAILAERERCAKIAEDEDGYFTWAGLTSTHNMLQRCCNEIAAAIRGDGHGEG